ncbi:MAG: thioredoxin fold domain-containing protein [Sulfuricellaceae bacterium]
MKVKNMVGLGKATLLALILTWMAPAWCYAAGNGEVPLARDLALDAKTAEARRVPILVMFTRPNCPFCAHVLKDFLEPMQRNAEYRAKVIMRKVNISSQAKLRDFSGGANTHREFALESGVGMVPVVMLYDSWGEVLAEPLLGFSSPDYYGDFLDQRINLALAKIRK